MSEPDDPGVLSLALRRRHASLEAEVAELRERNEQLAARLSASEGITAGHVSPHGYKCGHGMHLHVIVDERAPVVQCADCNERLDAYTVLLEFARAERHFMFALKDARREKEQLTEEIERLKRQRANLRRAIKQAGETPVDRWTKESTP